MHEITEELKGPWSKKITYQKSIFKERVNTNNGHDETNLVPRFGLALFLFCSLIY